MRFRTMIALICLLLARAAGAGLYDADAEVAGSGEAQRAAGVVAAFAGVLTKVTGRPDAPSWEAWPTLQEAAQGLVTQYRYQTETPPAALGTDVLNPRTRLWVQFDAAGVQQLLLRERLPVWGEARPATLLLLAIEDGAERFLFTPERVPAVQAALEQARVRREIPLLQPLMDLEDAELFRFTDVWAGFAESLWRGAARYQPDALLVGRLFRLGGTRWVGQWTLLIEQTRQAWETAGTQTEAVAAGLEESANRLAAHFVPSRLQGDARHLLAIQGLRRAADFTRVLDYLAGLGAVVAARPLELRQEQLQVEVTARVSADALQRLIALGEVLESVPVAAMQPAMALTFKLQP